MSTCEQYSPRFPSVTTATPTIACFDVHTGGCALPPDFCRNMHKNFESFLIEPRSVLFVWLDSLHGKASQVYVHMFVLLNGQGAAHTISHIQNARQGETYMQGSNIRCWPSSLSRSGHVIVECSFNHPLHCFPRTLPHDLHRSLAGRMSFGSHLLLIWAPHIMDGDPLLCTRMFALLRSVKAANELINMQSLRRGTTDLSSNIVCYTRTHSYQ
jgi:hypothetical protein